ncbi:aspartic peptidase domain-containing protein [Armillaria novae-zelandiae]|uniref:Aspartic peptidase domain-containing protein n=1 Tax=Armillaria novae-zelandiae TaxID=153914 RepID=A0AA39PNQ1_9AGAR|nr:aspartic peptidase domain-containing protein [Armillaria novae-zelandiae]
MTIAAIAIFAMLCLAGYSSGLRLQIEGQRNVQTHQELLRRGSMDGTAFLNYQSSIGYYTNLTLGGQPFTVMVDTGSADLWVSGNITDSIDTGETSRVTYGDGTTAEGPVKTSTLEFSGYTVEDQAFKNTVQITPGSDHPIGRGLIGLGPTTNSEIYSQLNTAAGYTVLDRIFLQNTSTPNYLTVLLGPTQVPAGVSTGEISIGEFLDGYSNVESQPKLAVTIAPSEQHFQVLLDQDGLLGPDGQPVSITTKINQTSNPKQATVMLDTGCTFSQVPKYIAEAIYSGVSGAEPQNITGMGGEVWIVPCDEEVNVTFKFGGNSYYVPPLDATMDPSLIDSLDSNNLVNSEGRSSCIGSFQPAIPGTKSETRDMILGMPFFRNVYAVFNFGDFVAGGNDTTNRGDPYVQLLSRIDPAKAHSDFVTARLSGSV